MLVDHNQLRKDTTMESIEEMFEKWWIEFGDHQGDNKTIELAAFKAGYSHGQSHPPTNNNN